MPWADRRHTDFAAAFAAPLLDPERPTPHGVNGPGAKAARSRYGVYRNNVTISLIDALSDTFPAVERIVGRDFFREMARLFVRAHPPTSPLLFEYGHALADFIDRFEPAATMPWLGDVARIERAWLDAYHAPDAEPLRPEALGAIGPESLGSAVFQPHPALHILRSSHPAVTIFSANRRQEPVGRISERAGEDALITRPHLEVFVRILPPGGAAFLMALRSGQPLADAAAHAFDAEPQFDLAANIAGMLEAGAFASVAINPPSHSEESLR